MTFGDDLAFRVYGYPVPSAEQLDQMRQRFYERYIDHRHCLIRLTEAQDPFFGSIEENHAEPAGEEG